MPGKRIANDPITVSEADSHRVGRVKQLKEELDERKAALDELLLRDRLLEAEARPPVRYLATLGAGLLAALLSLASVMLLFRLGLWIATGQSRRKENVHEHASGEF